MNTQKNRPLWQRLIVPSIILVLCIGIIICAAILKQNAQTISSIDLVLDEKDLTIEELEQKIKELQEQIDRTPVVEVETVAAELKNICELASAEQIMYDIYAYVENEGNIFKEKRFSMLYRADIKAGISFDHFDANVNIIVTDTQVQITLPKTSVLSIQIDPNSIQFYDEKNGLFNLANKEDAVFAQKDALLKLNERIETDEMFTRLLEKATENTELFIKSLIQPMIGDLEPVVNFQ